MAAINGFGGSLVVKTALILSALLFQRSGKIRHMEWSAINWKQHRWEIPTKKNENEDRSRVPLASQSLDLLNKLTKLTGDGKYVFPNARGPSRPLSDNGVRTALRTLGYDKETMTRYGFRAMARTLLDEVLGFRLEWIEHQLSYAVKDVIGRAYKRTTHLESRIK
jgi:integrase